MIVALVTLGALVADPVSLHGVELDGVEPAPAAGESPAADAERRSDGTPAEAAPEDSGTTEPSPPASESPAGEPPASELADPMDESLKKHERLEALIEHIKRQQSAMDTLEAHFLQRRESELLSETEESRGVFYYSAPDSVRWEYETPNPISVVIDGREMLTWYRDLQRADRYKIGRYSSQVFKYMGASGSMETLTDYFVVSVRFPELGPEGRPSGEYRLRLLPKYERISQKIKSMTLWIDAERYLPTRLRYESADSDVTEYDFHGFKVNDPIPTDRFSLDLPSDVKIREVDLQRNAG